MIDYWKLTRDYAPGDIVQRFAPGTGDLSPFVGRVTAVLKGIGFVDVQWPFGNERMSADDVVKVNPEFARHLPPTLDFSYYPGYDVRKASTRGSWRYRELPVTFHSELAAQWSKGASDLQAYDEMWHRHASTADDEVMRDEVARFYAFARKASDLRANCALTSKVAAYWVAQNRQYRVTQDELTVRKPVCPKCGTRMRRATYKMDKGARIRLWACPKDLFLIKQSDVLGPGGEPVEW